MVFRFADERYLAGLWAIAPYAKSSVDPPILPSLAVAEKLVVS
ncbi:uncharacterized protein METZ01_LOCUS148070 [marine metagenome]|uniref:Uncharacterized protein n=1 Tax=marine metagenome TaxID=408172 RepID=A0A382A118_9ZZZZ